MIIQHVGKVIASIITKRDTDIKIGTLELTKQFKSLIYQSVI